MENVGGTVRVKKELNDTWIDAGDDYNFDSMDSCRKVINDGTLSSYKSSVNHKNEDMALQERIDENIFIDCECKNLKLELTSLPTRICKSEPQNFQPLIVKMENEIQTDGDRKNGKRKSDTNENLPTNFNWKKVTSELKSSPMTSKAEYQRCQLIVKIENPVQTYSVIDKYLIILIKKEFDYNNKCQFLPKFRLKRGESQDVKILKKITKTTLSHTGNLSQQTYKGKASLNTRTKWPSKGIRPCENEICHKSFGLKRNLQTHINAVHDRSKPFECDICHKSFGRKGILKIHINALHDRSQHFECKICQKSFGLKCNLTKHVNTVHNHSKPFECEICHKGFRYQYVLNNHIDTVHNRSKPFECEMCHKSFGLKSNLNRHISAVHDRSKPFECEICHKSFGYKGTLKKHINAVHNGSKPFECEICQKPFGLKHHLEVHIGTVHNGSKPFECDICHKSFGEKGSLKKHINAVHNRSKPFECKNCHKSCGLKSILKIPINTVHTLKNHMNVEHD